MKDSISKEKVFAHSIDKVWKAISVGEEISSWFVKADFKPEVGYNYEFRSLGDEVCPLISGVVKEATPYTLVYTWEVENTNVETLVKWVLEQVGDQTKLTIEHSGISQYPGESAVKMFESFNGGWDNCVSELDKYLVKEFHAA
ncbi:MAG: SRPBCC domain-containing protein [Cyclobacteriaceae bacterium]